MPPRLPRTPRPVAPAPTRTEITTPEALSEESVVELSLRPQRLAEFIGQEKVKGNLRIAITAALGRKEPLDHILFHGPPGLGKTTLAELIARELGVNIHTTSGPAIEKPGDLVGKLTNLREGDILFIDEIHRLRPVIEEFLYPAMEDYKIDIRLSEGPKATTITMPVERFTLIGATTRFGMLTSPMRARFGIVTIAAAVGEDAGTIEEVYEPFLVQHGFLQRTPRGRMATNQAYRHFGYTPPESPTSAQPTLF